MTWVQCMGNEWNAFVQSRFLPFFHHLLFQKELGELPAPSERETGRQGSQISEVWLCCWQRAPLHYSPPCLDPWEYFGITTHYIYILHYSVWYGHIVEVGLCVYFIMTNATLVILMYTYATLWQMQVFCFAIIIQEQVWTCLNSS